MRGLSNAERLRALNEILPNSIKINKLGNELDNLHDFADSDLARGMLNNSTYRLVESITTADSKIEKSSVIPSNLDNLILTTSLAAYKKSKQMSHHGDILYTLPPFSFAYPLLLSYHLILHHISCSLLGANDDKFTTESGILIITDNIELLSHIWRTSINNIYLRDFVPVFTLEAGDFKKFNFNETSKRRTHQKKDFFDGSLPWIGIYRAYRHQLPETFRYQPEVIIIDLLPFRHRNRARELVAWAKDHSKHVITIAPSHDKVTQSLKNSFAHHFPVNKTSIKEIEQYFEIESKGISNPITSSWTIQSSLPFLRFDEINIYIKKAKITQSDFYEHLKLANEILRKARTQKGTIPIGFKKLHAILLSMLNTCLPLEWYERTRWVKSQPTLMELINRYSKIPPNDSEEVIIYETLMPHFYQCILRIYDFLNKCELNVRSQLLLNTIKEKIGEKSDITVIVSNPIDQEELKVWLNSIKVVPLEKLSKINIICQREWATQQLKEIYFNLDQEPDVIIIASPWHQKYISSFYFKEETEVILIDAYMELNLYKYQINSITQSDENFGFLHTINKLFNTNISSCKEINRTGNLQYIIQEVPVSFFVKNLTNEEKRNNVSVGDLFNDEIFFELLSENDYKDELEEEISEVGIISTENIENTYDGLIEHTNLIECVKVSVNNGNVMYIPTDIELKVKKFNQTEIKSMSPFELMKDDVWIRVKEKKKRELFEEILHLASNTLLMKWINTNVNEWRMMVREVWQKYYSSNKFHKHIYEEIKKDINLNGGNVESYLTISNWINGGLVRSIDNLSAIAKLCDDKRFERRKNIIYKSIRDLWGIHIKLGKALGNLIEEQVNKNLNKKIKMDKTQWINLGKDIVIPVEDILNTIEIIEISFINKSNTYLVFPSLTEKYFDKDLDIKLERKGLIRDGAEFN